MAGVREPLEYSMTTATAKTIQIYLPTGEPRGIRIAEITTRIIKAVLIPRSDLAQGKLRKELDLPGIYFLFGEDEDGAKPIVYIGQTEDARKRFDSHNKTKTFWKTAIFCVSKTQNFTQAHIRYLEWYCMQRAKEVNRYTLDNGQVPDNSTYVPEPMEAELLDVFETISTLVSTLGYPALNPLQSKAPHRSRSTAVVAVAMARANWSKTASSFTKEARPAWRLSLRR